MAAHALYETDGEKVRLNFHAGQDQAYFSERRFIVVLAGTQGGKTSFGPWWMQQEISRMGSGDYMIVTPTYPLLNLKALPEFLTVFQRILRLGTYSKSDRTFYISPYGEVRLFGRVQEQQTRIIFGYATDPDSLESATAKAAWLDEAGQNKFKLPSFEAIIRRLSIAEGRLLITTTLYNLGWLKQKFWDRRNSDPNIEMVRFDSTMNPLFPQREFERARDTLPDWKFDMFYRGIYARPAGMIYSCYDDELHVVDPFPIPADWPRYIGQDYGGVNTVAVFLAEAPDGMFYLYAEYGEPNRTAAEHAGAMRKIEKRPTAIYGGARSEDQWRREFWAAGMTVNAPDVTDVEVGIDRVFAAIKGDRFRIFSTCERTRDQLASYSRELNDLGEPTEKIEDKESFHFMDALRYIGSHVWRQYTRGMMPRQPVQVSKWQGPNASNGEGRWRQNFDAE